jgi:hypothetical protein
MFATAGVTAALSAKRGNGHTVTMALKGILSQYAAKSHLQAVYGGGEFADLAVIKSQHLGMIGEGVVRFMLEAAGQVVSDPENNSYDLQTETASHEVKTSRIGETGAFQFTGIRQDKSDIVDLVGFDRNAVRAWRIPTDQMVRIHRLKRRNTVAGRSITGIGFYTNGYSVFFNAANPPSWLDDFEVSAKDGQTSYERMTAR